MWAVLALTLRALPRTVPLLVLLILPLVPPTVVTSAFLAQGPGGAAPPLPAVKTVALALFIAITGRTPLLGLFPPSAPFLSPPYLRPPTTPLDVIKLSLLTLATTAGLLQTKLLLNTVKAWCRMRLQTPRRPIPNPVTWVRLGIPPAGTTVQRLRIPVLLMHPPCGAKPGPLTARFRTFRQLERPLPKQINLPPATIAVLACGQESSPVLHKDRMAVNALPVFTPNPVPVVCRRLSSEHRCGVNLCPPLPVLQCPTMVGTLVVKLRAVTKAPTLRPDLNLRRHPVLNALPAIATWVKYLQRALLRKVVTLPTCPQTTKSAGARMCLIEKVFLPTLVPRSVTAQSWSRPTLIS